MFNIIILEMFLEELKRIEHALKSLDLQRKIYLYDQTVRLQLEKLTENDHAAVILRRYWSLLKGIDVLFTYCCHIERRCGWYSLIS